MWYIIGSVVILAVFVLWSFVDDLKKADDYFPSMCNHNCNQGRTCNCVNKGE